MFFEYEVKTQKYINICTVMSNNFSVTLSKCLGGRTASLAASVDLLHHVRELNRLARTAHATVVCRGFICKEFWLLCNQMCLAAFKKHPCSLAPVTLCL